ncbi:hypothetical protein ATE84_5151 [Aquimarina sp. MAR_2010_214]|nr:hypothetical protein ATE84_5143 [Aquimarina sp. MAR_2010_214]PKV53018.1 hypothetical protein ATE84_5151 [Aquimarina sp. MAR_2010_214]
MKPKQNCIKIPITRPDEFLYMKNSLLENLYLLSQLDDNYEHNRGFKDAVYWISKILIASHLAEEREVITQQSKEASKLL